MRLLQFRLSIRSLMLLTALVSLTMGWIQLHRRSLAFRKIADEYAFHKDVRIFPSLPVLETAEEYAEWSKKLNERIRNRQLYFATLEQKYRRAARAPWLLVEPDPPRP